MSSQDAALAVLVVFKAVNVLVTAQKHYFVQRRLRSVTPVGFAYQRAATPLDSFRRLREDTAALAHLRQKLRACWSFLWIKLQTLSNDGGKFRILVSDLLRYRRLSVRGLNNDITLFTSAERVK